MLFAGLAGSITWKFLNLFHSFSEFFFVIAYFWLAAQKCFLNWKFDQFCKCLHYCLPMCYWDMYFSHTIPYWPYLDGKKSFICSGFIVFRKLYFNLVSTCISYNWGQFEDNYLNCYKSVNSWDKHCILYWIIAQEGSKFELNFIVLIQLTWDCWERFFAAYLHHFRTISMRAKFDR